MSGAIIPLPQYAFMAWCSVKHRDDFTFTFYLLPPLNRINFQNSILNGAALLTPRYFGIIDAIRGNTNGQNENQPKWDKTWHRSKSSRKALSLLARLIISVFNLSQCILAFSFITASQWQNINLEKCNISSLRDETFSNYVDMRNAKKNFGHRTSS
jgi:hypothetical protein